MILQKQYTHQRLEYDMKIKLDTLKQIIQEVVEEQRQDEQDPFADSMVSSWIKFVARNKGEFKNELRDAWDNMTSGMSMQNVVAAFSKAIGYEKPPGVAAGMPERGSEEEYLLGLRSGVRFHARQIKSGQTYPTFDEILEEFESRVTKEKERRAAAPPEKWHRPMYGYGTRIDPETGKKVSWTGTHERFN